MLKRIIAKLRKDKKALALAYPVFQKFKTNIKKWKFIGRGSFGYAYDIGNGRVCKITTSEREAKIALRLLKSKKKYSYLYNVLDVLILKNNGKFWLGLIITPKYRKLTDREKTDLYELFCLLDFAPSFRLRSTKQIKDKIKKSANDYYVPHSYEAGIINNIVDKRMNIFRKYNILYMLRNLKDANLGPEDMHYENILKDNDRYVLIDIAC